ncbi:MAG: ATP-binding protein [Dehalococcoidia bacterium]|nr:ATP-binding protein [Dehalococcoidia bacterium]
MFSKARWGLTLWFAGALALILAVIGVTVYAVARNSLYDQVDSGLESRAHRDLRPIGDQIVQRIGLGAPIGDITIGPAFTVGGYFYAMVADDGLIVASSPNVGPEGLAQMSDLQGALSGGPRFVDTHSSEGDDLRVYLLPLAGPRGRLFVLEIGRSTEPERQALNRLVLVLAGGGAGGLLLALAGGFLVAGRALRPIQVSMERQRRFIADASHELRTPLALIRANAEIMGREQREAAGDGGPSADDIIQETDRLSNLVTQMLKLARADAGEAPVLTELVDVSETASEAVRQMRLLAAPRQINLQLHAGGPAPVHGDETLVRELLNILLDNSIKYSDEGASVTVDVERGGGRVFLRVRDTGRGIAAEALPHIFERFYRADKARSREMGGTGLGLAIAKWIVDAHRGTISIESAVGRGTVVTVELPGARSGSA